MRKNKPSKTAYKVALNIVTLGAKPEMDEILPPGIVDATERLLIPEDLGKRKLVDVLKADELWDPSALTVIVAEGLVMYLPREAVRDLFRQWLQNELAARTASQPGCICKERICYFPLLLPSKSTILSLYFNISVQNKYADAATYFGQV